MSDVAKVTWSADGQSVELPEGYRFAATEVRITREGNRIVLEEAKDALDAASGLPMAELHRLIDEGLEGEDEPWDVEAIKRDVQAAVAAESASR